MRRATPFGTNPDGPGLASAGGGLALEGSEMIGEGGEGRGASAPA